MDGHFPLTLSSAVRLWLMVAWIAMSGFGQDAPVPAPAPGPTEPPAAAGPSPSSSFSPSFKDKIRQQTGDIKKMFRMADPSPAPAPSPAPVDEATRAADSATTRVVNFGESPPATQPPPSSDKDTETVYAMQILALEDRLIAVDPQFASPTVKMENLDRLARLQKRLDELNPPVFPDPTPEKRTLLERITIARISLMDLEHYQEYRRREIRNWTLGIGASVIVLAGIVFAIRRRMKRRITPAPSSPAPLAKPSDSAESMEPAKPTPPPQPPAPVSTPASEAETTPVRVASHPAPDPPAVLAPPVKKGRKLFISFSTSDLDFVENVLAPALREAGHVPWFSTVSIRPSDLWERSILSGLEECEWVLIVMSPHAVSSKWVQLETHWATEHREGRIVPLMIVRCNPWKLHMKLGNVQYVDFEHSPDAMADLLDIIETKSRTPEASR